MADILLVESEPWLAEVYQRALAQADHNVSTAVSAQAALNKLHLNMNIELLLVDLMLPGPGGLSLIYEILSHLDWQSKRFILLGDQLAESAVNDQANYEHLNVVAYLYKPRLRPTDLASIVEKHLQ